MEARIAPGGNPFYKDRLHLHPRSQVVVHSKQNWFASFQQRWKNCQGCPLHELRNRVVHFRGIIPARILLIGEAPGESEDELGRPFVGKAGKLLDELLEAAGVEDGDFCIVNTVGCIPKRLVDGRFEIGPPEKPEIRACSARLKELIEHVHPKLIVLLGNVAASSVDPFLPGLSIVQRLVHPSAIERGGRDPIQIKRFVLTLRQAIAGIPQ